MITKDDRIEMLEAEVKHLRLMLEAADHPVRLKIRLWLVDRPSGSPVEFHRDQPDISLGVAAYHFKVLLEQKELTLSKKRQRRGATEHYYRLRRNHPFLKLR